MLGIYESREFNQAESMKGKKVAILNMMYDNNYGGNLQRFAMVTLLQRMGCEVEYLYIRSAWKEGWMKSASLEKQVYRFLRQVVSHVVHPKTEPWLAWEKENQWYKDICAITEPFLERYVAHTEPIQSHKQLEKVFKRGNYDAVIAGSDQIWRKKYVEWYGLGTWFLDFVPEDFKGKRVIYGASFGVDEKEYNEADALFVRELYWKLDAVSVREQEGLRLVKEYGWEDPKAQMVLDPALLLTREDYEAVIDAAETHAGEGDMFCYILDESEKTMARIERIAKERNLKPFVRTIYGETNKESVEQWLRYIRDAKYVYTDSYHGFLFSLIFEKPYYVAVNYNRGASRFTSVMGNLELKPDEEPKWDEVKNRLEKLRKESIDYIERSLK